MSDFRFLGFWAANDHKRLFSSISSLDTHLWARHIVFNVNKDFTAPVETLSEHSWEVQEPHKQVCLVRPCNWVPWWAQNRFSINVSQLNKVSSTQLPWLVLVLGESATSSRRLSELKTDVASLSSFTARRVWHTWAVFIIWKNLLTFTCQSHSHQNPRPIENNPNTLKMRLDANKEKAYLGYYIPFIWG